MYLQAVLVHNFFFKNCLVDIRTASQKLQDFAVHYFSVINGFFFVVERWCLVLQDQLYPFFFFFFFFFPLFLSPQNCSSLLAMLIHFGIAKDSMSDGSSVKSSYWYNHLQLSKVSSELQTCLVSPGCILVLVYRVPLYCSWTGWRYRQVSVMCSRLCR